MHADAFREPMRALASPERAVWPAAGQLWTWSCPLILCVRTHLCGNNQWLRQRWWWLRRRGRPICSWCRDLRLGELLAVSWSAFSCAVVPRECCQRVDARSAQVPAHAPNRHTCTQRESAATHMQMESAARRSCVMRLRARSFGDLGQGYAHPSGHQIRRSTVRIVRWGPCPIASNRKLTLG